VTAMLYLEAVGVKLPIRHAMKPLISPLGGRYCAVSVFCTPNLNCALHTLEGMPVGTEEMLEKRHSVTVHGWAFAALGTGRTHRKFLQ
jgi:hypothetical protein